MAAVSRFGRDPFSESSWTRASCRGSGGQGSFSWKPIRRLESPASRHLDIQEDGRSPSAKSHRPSAEYVESAFRLEPLCPREGSEQVGENTVVISREDESSRHQRISFTIIDDVYNQVKPIGPIGPARRIEL